MDPTKKQTAGDRPSPQQRDERGRGVTPEEQQLGNTTSQDRRRVPRQSHERDESTPDAETSGAASPPSDEIMRRAHDDVVSGKEDTSRSQEMDRTYHRVRNTK